MILALLTSPLQPSSAQSSPTSDTAAIRGTVLNGVSRAPIPGALVVSQDNRYAARTDSQGRFEFTVPRSEPAQSPAADLADVSQETKGGIAPEILRPLMLSARKPGFYESGNTSARDLVQTPSEVTLFLMPEAVIAGHVSLPGSEAPDKIQLQLFRRVVQNGHAQWVPAGTTASRSNGDFRFADLQAGTYKLLTRELLDQAALGSADREQLYGYPPVYYPDAGDFGSAQEIELSPGATAEPRLSLVKQPYFPVKILLANPPAGVLGMNINVSSQKGRAGPGYDLRYNVGTREIEGFLPSGTYIVEAIVSGAAPAAGSMTLVVKGAAVSDAHLALMTAGSINVEVREEFTNKEPDNNATFTTYHDGKRRTFALRGPRQYLSLGLESADELATAKSGFLRPPTGPNDTALVLEGIVPGRYWVRVQAFRGYAASVRSGTTDLLREPLVVGGATGTIEVTMRDDSGQIAGQVEGLAPPPSTPETSGLPLAVVYCVPVPGSTGQFAEIGVAPDGSFSSQPMAPGEYRVLAFDRQHADLEYRNPEAMKQYDSQGSVVRIAAGQAEHVQLQLISTPE